MVARGIVAFSALRAAIAFEVVHEADVEATGGSCVKHWKHQDYGLDKCNTDHDPSGCHGGSDAADCFCEKTHGKGWAAASLKTDKHHKKTWSCSKDHSNVCAGQCECISQVTCKAPKVTLVVENPFHCGPEPGTYEDFSWQFGSEASWDAKKEERTELASSISSKINLSDLVEGMDVKYKDSETEILSDTFSYAGHIGYSVTNKVHIDCTTKNYVYTARSEITTGKGKVLTLKGKSWFITSKPLKFKKSNSVTYTIPDDSYMFNNSSVAV